MESPINVLIVDDEPTVLLLIKKIVAQEFPDLSVQTASSGAEALQILNTENISILMTDLIMPEMDGFTLIQTAKELYPELNIIIITGVASLDSAMEGAKKGAHGYLTKPLDRELLKITINNCLNKLQAKQNLTKTAKELETITTAIEQCPLSITITDAEGNIKFTTISAGTHTEKIEKQPSWLLENDGMPDDVHKSLWQTIKSGNVWTGEISHQKENEKLRWQRVVVSPVSDKAGDIISYIVVQEDITKGKAMEENQQQILIKTMAQDKLATLGEIATGIAHEINQPLTYINTVLHTTMEKISQNNLDPQKLREKLERAAHQANRITGIITHLRTFGHSEQGVFVRINLATILDNTLILMQERLRVNNVTLHKTIEDNLPIIMGDAHKLEQIFINLFQNSLDALSEQKSAEINLNIARKNSGVEIIFSDNGPGMPPEILKKICEPFFTTKEVGKGTGMGMAIVFGIVTEHHGEIICESEPGQGASFKITLPADRRAH